MWHTVVEAKYSYPKNLETLLLIECMKEEEKSVIILRVSGIEIRRLVGVLGYLVN